MLCCSSTIILDDRYKLIHNQGFKLKKTKEVLLPYRPSISNYISCKLEKPKSSSYIHYEEITWIQHFPVASATGAYPIDNVQLNTRH